MKLPYNPATCTYLGTTTGKRPVSTADNAKNVFVCGTTGSGKTVVLSNYIRRAVEMDFPALIVDGKGDTGAGSLLDIVRKLQGNKKVYVINMTDPAHSDKYNPFRNASPTIAKDMLINLTEWSEEHYKLNTERYLQRLVYLLHMAGIPMTFQNIIRYMPAEQFKDLSAALLKDEKLTKADHTLNTELLKSSGRIAENALARFATIAESELGQIFSDSGIDIYTAMQENAIILFILNPLLYPELSPLMGRLITIDSKKAISRLYQSGNGRIFFIMDEINVYASTALVDLVNKSRSANVTCILATQSLSDLDAAVNEAYKEQIIENCNNYIVLRQNSSINAEHWANVLGTKEGVEVTNQIQQTFMGATETGLGSTKLVREYIYHPDVIKTLQTGRGIFLSRDLNAHCKLNVHKPF